jgi:long-chain acyl-CoA synthetase
LREHLAKFLEDFRRHNWEIAVVRYQGNRRRVATYGRLAQLAGRFAALLEERGIGSGDRVLLWAENSAEWMAAFYGCMLRGVIVVPLDTFGSADFATRVAADIRPKLVVGDAILLNKLNLSHSSGHVAHACPSVAFENWLDALPAREAGPVAGLSRETPLQILFTSGTTGDPKGIVHTHGNVLASIDPIEQGAQGYLRYEWLVHPLRFLHTLPLSHVFGQTMGLWIPPIFAAELHFENRLVAPRLVETLKRERISVLAAVPRVMALLKSYLESSTPGLPARVAASSRMKAWKRWWVFRDVHRTLGFKFWALISGGGALAGPLEQFWNALGFVVVQGYGMTETTALITLNHPFHVARGTIGKPLPGREVKLGPDGEVLVRGAMISTATWSGGELRERKDDWLATGDLAETQTTGELRFMGRKSETIVTATGVNIHPEDLEAVLEQQAGIAASAVVAVDTAAGPEPCAVLAIRSDPVAAAQAVERANSRLAEFQRVRRWMVWPEPDLPRTSTGKVRRKAVAEWVHGQSAVPATSGEAVTLSAEGSDWLLNLVASISGEKHPAGGDELRLDEDLHLDSLGRVQLAAALEERVADAPPEGAVDVARTLGDLRKLVGASSRHRERSYADNPDTSHLLYSQEGPAQPGPSSAFLKEPVPAGSPETSSWLPAEAGEKSGYIYPRWPWWSPVQLLRVAFLEAVAQPLVWLLAKPTVTRPADIPADEPILIVCNHVTAYDGPLVQYALPARIRNRIAAAMSGEMLEDFRHFRNPDRKPGQRKFMFFGPAAYWLLTALYNVFPLPRRRDFQRSFSHAGEALDRGYNVLVFPEGTRSESGTLANFRPGIGMLVKQSHTAVLPVAILGLGELKDQGQRWFRSGRIEVRVGKPVRFAPEESEATITARLHAEVESLMIHAG